MVTVFVRDPAKAPAPHDRLRVVTGSLLDEAALTAAVRGQDAVISAIGRGRSFKSEHLMEQVVPPLVSAMKAAGVRRLIFMSALGVGDSYQDSPVIGRLFFRTLLRGIYADKAVGDRLIRTSGLEWTLVQPSQLTDGPLTRNYRHGERLALSGMSSSAWRLVAKCCSPDEARNTSSAVTALATEARRRRKTPSAIANRPAGVSPAAGRRLMPRSIAAAATRRIDANARAMSSSVQPAVPTRD